jgi:1,4-dihydroxy-2-naphthoyl-CoA hydrolase
MVPPEAPALLNETLGFELTELGDERALAHVSVTDRVMQPLGLVHGGVYAALAESLVSAATHEAVRGDGFLAVGMSNLTSFVRPVTDGTVFAEATRLHRGRTSWVWEVRLTDEAGRLCAVSRITMAVRRQGD